MADRCCRSNTAVRSGGFSGTNRDEGRPKAMADHTEMTVKKKSSCTRSSGNGASGPPRASFGARSDSSIRRSPGEQLHGLRLASALRPAKRCVPVPVLRAWVGAGAEQRLHHVDLTPRCGCVQRRVLELAPAEHVRVGAGVDERDGGLAVSCCGRHQQRCLPPSVRRIDLGASLEQRGDDVDVPEGCGPVQRRVAVGICCVEVAFPAERTSQRARTAKRCVYLRRLCCKPDVGVKSDQDDNRACVMSRRWPDGPVAMPWPRSGRTVRRRRRARRSEPRRQCRPGGRTSRLDPCAARASPRSP